MKLSHLGKRKISIITLKKLSFPGDYFDILFTEVQGNIIIHLDISKNSYLEIMFRVVANNMKTLLNDPYKF